MEEPLIATSTNKESRSRRLLKRMTAKGLIYAGGEPRVEILDVDSDDVIKFKLIKAFNWYSYAYDSKKARQWIVEYLRTIKKDKKSATLVSAATEYYSNTAGWIARLLISGTENIPSHYTDYLDKTISKMKEDGLKNADNYQKKLDRLHNGRLKAQKNQQNKVKELTDQYIGELEEQIDLFVDNGFKTEFNVESFLKENTVIQEQASDIAKWFERNIPELTAACNKTDEYYVEAYSHLSNKQLKNLLCFIQSIVKASLDYSEIAPTTNAKVRKQRKPRQKKIKPAGEQVKKLLYLKESKEFKLNSIQPEKIIGATQLWVFNTKYRYLGVYHCPDSAGFSIKGSTLKNFDTNISVEKKLRKPNEILPEVLEGGKVALRKLLQPIRCKEKKLTGRINKHTILLRVL